MQIHVFYQNVSKTQKESRILPEVINQNTQYLPCVCSHARRASSSGWAMNINNHGSYVGTSMMAIKRHLREKKKSRENGEYLMRQMLPRRLYTLISLYSYGFLKG